MDENSICIIAENIDRIAKKQFYNQKFIKQVVIPESVHYIEAWAFAYYTSLCGYVHEGEDAPEQCPVCAHPQSYFEVNAENY